MTLYGLIASLAWTAAAVLFVRTLNGIAMRWLDAREQTRVATTPTEIPDDLVALAMGETERWAQDSILDVCRERFDKLKDWNKVRSAMGIGEVSA